FLGPRAVCRTVARRGACENRARGTARARMIPRSRYALGQAARWMSLGAPHEISHFDRLQARRSLSHLVTFLGHVSWSRFLVTSFWSRFFGHVSLVTFLAGLSEGEPGAPPGASRSDAWVGAGVWGRSPHPKEAGRWMQPSTFQTAQKGHPPKGSTVGPFAPM